MDIFHESGKFRDQIIAVSVLFSIIVDIGMNGGSRDQSIAVSVIFSIVVEM
jgi:hypothetical protein